VIVPILRLLADAALSVAPEANSSANFRLFTFLLPFDDW
jgi:hypothetical protein